MPIQLDFILRRLAEMAEADPSSVTGSPGRPPTSATTPGWRVLAEHYSGDDTNVKTLGRGVSLAAFADITVEDFDGAPRRSCAGLDHPTLGRGYLECAYAPMVELLSHLRANGFTNYIASGGGRDFMRPISNEVYGVPREGVIGSARLSRTHPVTTAARSPARRPPTTWTTVPRSRCTSGPAQGVARCSRRATPTATSRCSTSPSTPTSRRSACWSLHDDVDREFDYVSGVRDAPSNAPPTAAGQWSA